MTIWRRVTCCISKPTRTQAHASTCEPTTTLTGAVTHMYKHIEVRNTYSFSTTTIYVVHALPVVFFIKVAHYIFLRSEIVTYYLVKCKVFST